MLARNAHFAGWTDEDERAELVAIYEKQAGRYFADATKRQSAEFHATLAALRPRIDAPAWDRARAKADRDFFNATTEARALFDRTMAELLATGEMSEELGEEWTALERANVAAEREAA